MKKWFSGPYNRFSLLGAKIIVAPTALCVCLSVCLSVGRGGGGGGGGEGEV